MKYIATEKFASLGIENSWQGLHHEDFMALKHGEAVELKNPPDHLLEGGYIKKAAKEKKNGS